MVEPISSVPGGDERANLREERMAQMRSRRMMRILEREVRMSGDKEKIKQELNNLIDSLEG
jgi:hypothetical protein